MLGIRAWWLAFIRNLVARGLTRVKLVTSDAHAGLTAAIAATLPGAALAAGAARITPRT